MEYTKEENVHKENLLLLYKRIVVYYSCELVGNDQSTTYNVWILTMVLVWLVTYFA